MSLGHGLDKGLNEAQQLGWRPRGALWPDENEPTITASMNVAENMARLNPIEVVAADAVTDGYAFPIRQTNSSQSLASSGF